MGRLRDTQGHKSWTLPSLCLIGRSRTCAIRLTEPEVSGEQALLRWKHGIWEVQDLHSRNGTFVDGRQLDGGELVGLHEHAVLGFGRPDGYELADIGAPRAHAVDVDGTRATIEADQDLLVLEPERPELSIYPRDQRWWLERADDMREVQDGEIVEAVGARWRLHLPERLPQTHELSTQLRLASLSLRFCVSDEERHVDLVAQHGERSIDLKARAHHRPLLLLARARLDDRELPSEQQGWVHQEDIVRSLGTDSNRFYVDIYRLRRQLAEVGIVDAEHIIDRRPGTRQLRIGVSRLEIVKNERARSLR